MNKNYLIGKLINSLGYDLKPKWKTAQANIHPIDLAASLVLSQNNGNIESVLQIGVYDGIQDDPLSHRILNYAKKNILVEPQPLLAKILRDRYKYDTRFSIIEAAISDVSGLIPLYGESQSTPRASLNKEHFIKFGIKNPIQIGVVRSITPDALVAEIGGNCPTIIQIDTEGYDWKILKLFFDKGYLPKIINFENFHLTKGERLESRDLLTKLGYSYIEYGFDTCAIYDFYKINE